MFSEDALYVDESPFAVDIIRAYGNNLETGEKGIGLFADGHLLIAFNWSEADAVAAALKQVTGIARNG
jgi:hypothetical protein